MIIGKTPRQPIIFNINQIKRKESQKVVQMGVITDNWSYFKDHIDILCSTANYGLLIRNSWIEKNEGNISLWEKQN